MNSVVLSVLELCALASSSYNRLLVNVLVVNHLEGFLLGFHLHDLVHTERDLGYLFDVSAILLCLLGNNLGRSECQLSARPNSMIDRLALGRFSSKVAGAIGSIGIERVVQVLPDSDESRSIRWRR